VCEGKWSNSVHKRGGDLCWHLGIPTEGNPHHGKTAGRRGRGQFRLHGVPGSAERGPNTSAKASKEDGDESGSR